MKLTTLLIALIITSINTYAVYVRNVPVVVNQPDGQKLECFITGDEFHRRLHDADNYTILQDPASGWYVYAIKTGDDLTFSSYRVGQANPSTLGLVPGLDIPYETMEEKRETQLKSASVEIQPHTTGDFSNLVVFVRFADDPEFIGQSGEYDLLMNGGNPGDNSLKNFYHKASGGQLTITSHLFPLALDGQVISYKDDQFRNYYKPFSSLNPIGYATNEERYTREANLISNVVSMMSEDLPADIVIDANGDGLVDNLSLIIQGEFDIWGGLLWPHMGQMSGSEIYLAQKRIFRYNILIENFIRTEGARVVYHEFFHTLGAPDLYRYQNTDIEPVGIWDLMGSYTGYTITAYMKWKYGKWFNEIPVITSPGAYQLEAIEDSPFASYKINSLVNSHEYFVLEYRRNNGMIIARVNELVTGNAGGPPDEIYVYRQGGTPDVHGNIFEAAFSFNNGRTEFSQFSDPSCFLSDGTLAQIDLSDISTALSTISFNVNEYNPYPVPQNPALASLSGTPTLTWDPPLPGIYLLMGYQIYYGSAEVPLFNEPITITSMALPPATDPDSLFKISAVYETGNSSKVAVKRSSDPVPVQAGQWVHYTAGNLIASIARDGENLWIAGGGLNKLNTSTGENLNYNKGNSGLIANDVTSVAIDRQGDKWIGLYNGNFMHFDGISWNLVEAPVPEYQIIDSDLDSNDTLWCSVWGAGLCKLTSHGWVKYDESNSGLPNNYIWCMEFDGQGNLWLGMTGNLVKFDGQNWQVFNMVDAGIPGVAVSALIMGDNGILWIGTQHGGLIRYDGVDFSVVSGLSGNVIYSLEKDPTGNIWAGSESSLIRLNNFEPHFYPTQGRVTTIKSDHAGRIWYGTLGNGLFLLENGESKRYKTGNSDLLSDRQWNISFPDSYETWIGTEQNGAVKFDGEKWEPRLFDFWGTNQAGINRIKKGPEGTLWFATERGLACLKNDSVGYITPENSPLPGHIVYDILIDNTGKFWFATSEGLASLQGSEWTIYNTSNSVLIDNAVSAVNQAADGTIWFGYKNMGGVTRFDGSSFLNYPVGVNGPQTTNTYKIYFDRTGDMWITGHMCAYASKFDGVEWHQHYNLWNIREVVQDKNGQFWFAGYFKGLITLKDNTWINYDIYNSGMPSNMVTTISIDSLDNIWIGTYGGGVSIFNESGLQRRPFAKIAQPEGLLPGALVSLNGSGSFDPDGDSLTFRWSAPEGIVLKQADTAYPTFSAPDVDSDQTLTFYLIVNDGKLDSKTAEVTVLVKDVPNPRVTFPSEPGIIWNPGNIYEITWQDFNDPYVKIELLKGETVVRTVTSGTVNDGTMLWKAPALQPGSDYRIRITSTTNSEISDLSNYHFTLAPAVSPKISYPSEPGIVWNPGEIYEITWQDFTDPYVKLELLKGETVVRTITTGTANDGTMLWRAPAIDPGADYRIRITSTATPSMTDLSDNFFAIQPAAMPNVIYPSESGLVWNPGTIYEILWQDFTDPYVKIELLKGTVVVRTVTTGTANDGAMLWRAPTLESGTDYRIRITSTANPAMTDISDEYFALQPSASPRISYPSEPGIAWTPGTIYEITWQDFTDPYVKLELLSGSTVVRTITSVTPNDGTMLWRAPALASGADYRIRITSTVNPSMTDISDNAFRISGPPQVTYPSSTGIVWNVGTIYEITWQDFTDPYVKLELLKGETVVRTITSATANDGAMLWRIATTLEPGTDYRVRITSTATPTMTDVSDNPVTIVVPKSATAFGDDPGENDLSVYPNPFSDRATITYTLAETGRTLLEIYDLTGRRVTTLQDTNLEAGTYVTEWNATDSNGRQVVPGVYLVRIQSGGFVETSKLVKK